MSRADVHPVTQCSRRGDWICTYTGIKFYPLDPRPEEVDIRDIAHALANICRFNGHCVRFYSVAQHSVLVSRIVPAKFAFEALLHDAAEAYVSDCPTPIKRELQLLTIMEHLVMGAIASRFGLPKDGFHAEIHEADLIALATEKRDLMNAERQDWGNLPVPMKDRIFPVCPAAAEAEFMGWFEELCPAAVR